MPGVVQEREWYSHYRAELLCTPVTLPVTCSRWNSDGIAWHKVTVQLLKLSLTVNLDGVQVEGNAQAIAICQIFIYLFLLRTKSNNSGIGRLLLSAIAT